MADLSNCFLLAFEPLSRKLYLIYSTKDVHKFHDPIPADTGHLYPYVYVALKNEQINRDKIKFKGHAKLDTFRSMLYT